jgi:hypothetical protein
VSDRGSLGRAVEVKNLPRSCSALPGRTSIGSVASLVLPPSCESLKLRPAYLCLAKSASCILYRLDPQGGITSGLSYLGIKTLYYTIDLYWLMSADVPRYPITQLFLTGVDSLIGYA